MNTKPITEARDADLRLSMVALERAALRARAIATQTGTAIAVYRDGVIEYIPADYARSTTSPAPSEQESAPKLMPKA